MIHSQQINDDLSNDGDTSAHLLGTAHVMTSLLVFIMDYSLYALVDAMTGNSPNAIMDAAFIQYN